VLQPQLERAARQTDGVLGLPDQRRQVEHLEDALERHHGGHHVDPDVRQRRQRAVEPAEQGREREQRADAQLPEMASRPPAP
jgi:hypothetical protein